MDSLKYFLLFIFQPFWALVIFLLNISKKTPNYFDIVVITFTISLLGIYWYPWGDPQTYFAIYYADIVHRFYSFSIFNSNFIYSFVLTYIAEIFGNFVWGYFFWIFFPLLIYNLSIWKYAKSYKGYSYLLVSLILILGIRESLDLNRNMAAALIAGGALLNYNKKFLFIIFSSIACLMHSTLLIIFPCAFVLYPILHKLRKRKLIILLIISFLFSFAMTSILSNLIVGKLALLYLEGSNAEGTGVGSGFFYLMTICNIIICFLILVIFLLNYDNIKSNFGFSMYLTSTLISLATWFLWTMRERFLLVNLVFGFAVIIINWRYLKLDIWFNKYKLIKSIITLSVCRLLFVLCVEYSSEYIHHTGSLSPDKTIKIVSRSFFLPTPLLLDVDEFGFNDYLYNTLFYRTRDVIKAHHL